MTIFRLCSATVSASPASFIRASLRGSEHAPSAAQAVKTRRATRNRSAARKIRPGSDLATSPARANFTLPPRPLLPQQSEQHVVLPFTVDAEVFVGVAFLAEAAAGE